MRSSADRSLDSAAVIARVSRSRGMIVDLGKMRGCGAAKRIIRCIQ